MDDNYEHCVCCPLLTTLCTRFPVWLRLTFDNSSPTLLYILTFIHPMDLNHLQNNRCLSTLWFSNFQTHFDRCVRRDAGEGKKAFEGHVVMEELGQRTIFVLTVFIVSSSPPLSLVGYHVYPIYTFSRDSQLSVPSHLVLPKNNGLKKRSLKEYFGFFWSGVIWHTHP